MMLLVLKGVVVALAVVGAAALLYIGVFYLASWIDKDEDDEPRT